MAGDKTNIKTMEGDMNSARNATKGVVLPEAGSSDLLKEIELKLANASFAAKPLVGTAKEKTAAGPRHAGSDGLAPISGSGMGLQMAPPLPPSADESEVEAAETPAVDQIKIEIEPAPSIKAAEIADTEKQKKEEDDRARAAQEQLRVSEEKKRAEMRQKLEIERRQREEERRKKEEQRRRIFEEAERQRLEREKTKKQEKEEALKKQRAEEEANRLKTQQLQSEMELLERQRQRTLPVVLRELKKRIRVHRSELEKEAVALASKEAPLNDQKVQLESKVSVIANGELKDAILSEQEIEAKEEEFLKSTKHKQSSLEQEKIVSQRIWEIEDRRKIAEKTRWDIEDRVKKIKAQIGEVDVQIEQEKKNRERVREQIKTLVAQEKLVDFAEWKKGVEEEILAVEEERDSLAPVLERARNEKEAAQAALDQISERQRSAEENLRVIEAKEKEERDPELKRTTEQSRWDIGNDIRKTTQEKWECEKQLDDAKIFEKEQQLKLDKINAKHNALEDKISAQESILAKVKISPKRLRDQVSAMLAANELEVDPMILEDITQIEESVFVPAPVALPVQENIELDQKKSPEPVETIADQADVAEPVREDAKQVTAEPAAEPAVETAEPVQATPAAEPAVKEAEPAVVAELPVTEKTEPEPEVEVEPAAAKTDLPEKTEAKAVATPKIQTGEKKSAVILPKVLPGMFREPIDDQPVSPMNVPVFPDQSANPVSDSGVVVENNDNAGPAKEPGEFAIPAGNLGIPEIQETKEFQPAEGDLENRWTAIANANDAVVSRQEGAGPGLEPLRVPKRAKNNRKLIIQILIAILIPAVIGGIAAFIILTKKQQPVIKTVPVVTKKTTTPSQTNNNSPKSNPVVSNGSAQTPAQTPGGAPQSLIGIVSNVTIITDNLDSVPSLISPYLTTNRDVDGYYRLLIQDKKDGTYVGLRQLFDIFKIKAPSGLLNDLNNDATIFLYSNQGQNRFGFIASTSSTADVAQIMKGWENTMEQDTDGLFKFLGKKLPSKTPGNFQNATAGTQQVVYRYNFFQPDSANLGICYTTYKNYLIFASSANSLTQIFSQLPQ